MIESSYLLAFTTGLLGGFGHCVGMCGPIVAAQTFRGADHARSAPAAQLLYNAGRVTTYAAVGGLMGFAGSFVNVAAGLAGIQNAVMIIAGLAMIYLGLGIAGLVPGVSRIERKNAGILRIAGRLRLSGSPWKFYPLGLILGLLPCGLSATAFLAAAATGSPASGFLLMLCFGAGTMPALFLFGMVVTALSSRLRGWLYRCGGIVVSVMGALFVIRGAGSYAAM